MVEDAVAPEEEGAAAGGQAHAHNVRVGADERLEAEVPEGARDGENASRSHAGGALVHHEAAEEFYAELLVYWGREGREVKWDARAGRSAAGSVTEAAGAVGGRHGLGGGTQSARRRRRRPHRRG